MYYRLSIAALIAGLCLLALALFQGCTIVKVRECPMYINIVSNSIGVCP